MHVQPLEVQQAHINIRARYLGKTSSDALPQYHVQSCYCAYHARDRQHRALPSTQCDPEVAARRKYKAEGCENHTTHGVRYQLSVVM